MRISEDRYSRDLRRLNLARRFIQHNVRTRWICRLTGLSDSRVRNLFHSYQGSRVRRGRPRGSKSFFLKSPTLRDEASAAGSLAYVLGAFAPGRAAGRSLETGERLCDAFDFYREVIPEARLTLDELILLVEALEEGSELEIGRCAQCHCAWLVDRLGTDRRICASCKEHVRCAAVPPMTSFPVVGTPLDPVEAQLPLDL